MKKKLPHYCVHDKKNKHKTVGVLHIHNILAKQILVDEKKKNSKDYY